MSTKLETILMVEDEPDIQTVAKLSLESIGGFKVEVCSSGQEAIEKAADIKPDLILLDVMMPGMDGPTTLLELKKIPQLSNTPVVFMTAKVQPQEIQQYKEYGAIDVIPKPFDPMSLAENLNSIWTRYNESP
jgi:CheY-like chemotaxis protein